MNRMLRAPKSLLTLALIALAALFAVGCGDSGSDEPADVQVKNALAKAAEIKSGVAEIEASINTGGFPGNIKLDGGGPFDTQASGGAAYSLDFPVGVAGTEQQLGLVSVDGKNYIVAGDVAVEQKGDAATTFEPGQISEFIASLGDHLSDVTEGSEAEADGQTLTSFNAKLDIKKMIEDAQADGSEVSKLSIPGLGSAEELAGQVSTADLTIGIADDGLPRLLTIDVPITSDGMEGGVRGTLILTKIDEPVTVEKPANITDDPAALGVIGQFLGAE
jgi:hypothetical protein